MGSNLLGLIVTILIGSCFRLLAYSVILWLFLFPLRKNAGGFHAGKPVSCFLMSAAIQVLELYCLVQFIFSVKICLFIAIVFIVVIISLAPVDNHNKSFDMIEYNVYRKRTRIVLIVEIIIFILSMLLNQELFYKAIAMSFSLEGLSLIIGKLKLQKTKKELEMDLRSAIKKR